MVRYVVLAALLLVVLDAYMVTGNELWSAVFVLDALWIVSS